MNDNTIGPENAAVEYPVDGVLDLHLFKPQDIKTLLPDYLAECRKKGILQVRIIHGKGTGTLRHTVHTILTRLPIVADFRQAELQAGSWGATIVHLKKMQGASSVD